MVARARINWNLGKRTILFVDEIHRFNKAQQDAIVVVEDFDFEAPKTKEFVNLQKNLKIEGKKLLLVLPDVKKNVYLSARNIQKAEVMTASALNTYKVLNANVLVVTENALKLVDETFNK